MDFWGRTDFNLVAHGARDIALINGADEIVTALEDSLVTLANIKGSRFVAPIKVKSYDFVVFLLFSLFYISISFFQHLVSYSVFFFLFPFHSHSSSLSLSV